MIRTLKGDITRLDFDIIVNAANEHLMAGSGVCGAIFAAAGRELDKECQKIGHCDCGQAVLTNSYNLPSSAIIHTVGPVYQDGNHQEDEYLQACYWNCMSVAYDFLRKNKLDELSLAFPCISTGIFGFPKEKACQIAVNTVRKVMREFPDAKVIDVTFVCFTQEDYMYYKKELGSHEING